MDFLHQTNAFVLDPVQIAGGSELALGLQMALSHQRRQHCVDAGDTLFGDKWQRYMTIATRLGFELLATVPFTDRNNIHDILAILVHRESGALLTVESYSAGAQAPDYDGPSVNTAELYFVVKKNLPGAPWSGGSESLSAPDWRHNDAYFDSEEGTYKYPQDLLFVGYCDARECLASKLAQVLSAEPQPRPTSARFRCLNAIGHRADFPERMSYAGSNAIKHIREERLHALFETPQARQLFGFA